MPATHVHTYGDWAYFTEADSCEQHVYYRVCESCNNMELKKGSSSDHVWKTEDTYNNSFHWYECENCNQIKDEVEHTPDSTGACTVCNALVGATERVLYALSEDGTYAEVTGYEGEAKRVRIADTYEGKPVTSIAAEAFTYKKITDVVIPDSVTSIGDGAFYYCTSLTSVDIGDGVMSIGDEAFSRCTSLTSVTIPDSVTSIGDWAFYDCTSLTSITVSGSNSAYKSIEGNLYSKDEKTLIQYAIGKTATSFTIPDSVTSIGDRAFQDCSSLTSVVIPNSVKSIGDWAFYYCTSLTSIEIPASVTSIGDWAFNNCDSLTSITVDENNANYKDIDGNLYSKDGTTFIQYAIGKMVTFFTIPDGVTSIGEGAFEGCDSLMSVVIPNSVTSIGDWAFQACTSLTSVVIPDSVKSIGDWAFGDCYSLVSVVIPDSVTSMGADVFANCENLVFLLIGNGVTSIGEYEFWFCYSLTSVVIGNGVTSIGKLAFWDCYSLASVVIGNGVTSIGGGTFYGCYNLTNIRFAGTVAEWNAIDKGSNWNKDVPATEVICSDGVVTL